MGAIGDSILQKGTGATKAPTYTPQRIGGMTLAGRPVYEKTPPTLLQRLFQPYATEGPEFVSPFKAGISGVERISRAFEAPSRIVERLITAPFRKQTYEQLGMPGAMAGVTRMLADPLWLIAPAKIPVAGKVLARTGEPALAAKALRGLPFEKVAAGLGARESLALQRAMMAPTPIGKALAPAAEALGRIAAPTITAIKEEIGWAVPKQLEKELSKFVGRQSIIGAGELKFARQQVEGLTKFERFRVGQLIGGAIPSDKPLQLVGEIVDDAKLMKVSTLFRERYDDLSREIVTLMNRRDIPVSRTLTAAVSRNIGKYRPRIYKEFLENPDDFVRQLGNPTKRTILMNRLMKTKEGVQLSRIVEAGMPEAVGMTTMRRMVEQAKFLRHVADNFAHKAPVEGISLVQIPLSPKWGALSGRFVDRSVYNAVRGTLRIIIGDPDFDEKMLKQVVGLNRLWKAFKVLPNPATHVRNLISNVMLADIIGGVPLWQQPKYWRVAIQDYTARGPAFKWLSENTDLMAGTYYGTEIAPFLRLFEDTPGNAISKFTNLAKRMGQGAGDLYQAEERIGKIMIFLAQREKGLAPEAAAELAERALFNYRKVNKAVDFLRRYPLGAPFITFHSKAIPAIAVAAVQHPAGIIAKYFKAVREVANLSAEALAKEKEVLPRYMLDGMYLRLPWEDNQGRAQYLDLNYIIPWGELYDVPRRVPPGTPPLATLATVLGGPAKVLFNVQANWDDFTGSKIWESYDDWKTKNHKLASYLVDQLAPAGPLMPGSFSSDKLGDALFAKPDYYGNVRNIPTTLFDVFAGLKVRPVEYARERRWRGYEKEQAIAEIKKEINRIHRTKEYAPEEKARMIRDLQERIVDIQTAPATKRFGK